LIIVKTYPSDAATSCGPRFQTQAVLTCDLVTLTLDISTSKWGHGSPGVTGFHPANVQLGKPFRSPLRVSHSTDRRTDRQRSSTRYAPPYVDSSI